MKVGRRNVQVDDETLEAELTSDRGKHPKWNSLMQDESFILDATEYVRENGYVKGAPNLTMADFVLWVNERYVKKYNGFFLPPVQQKIVF